MNEKIRIPHDIYESWQEIVIIMPLGGVKKESLKISIEDYKLLIQGDRAEFNPKEGLILVKEECYRGKIFQTIDLPSQIYFDKIHSKLSPENILQIIIPKAIIPDHINLEIES